MLGKHKSSLAYHAFKMCCQAVQITHERQSPPRKRRHSRGEHWQSSPGFPPSVCEALLCSCSHLLLTLLSDAKKAKMCNWGERCCFYNLFLFKLRAPRIHSGGWITLEFLQGSPFLVVGVDAFLPGGRSHSHSGRTGTAPSLSLRRGVTAVESWWRASDSLTFSWLLAESGLIPETFIRVIF